MPSHTPAPRDPAALLQLLTADPGRPRLTWYGDDGERVELSGAVLANWVAKTTNLLVEELDAGPGTGVGSDLPPHWRTVLWALATWRAGATLVVPGDATARVGDDVDVLLTTSPPEPAPRAALVVVTLAALARRADGPLPAGAVDAAAAVMTYADQLGWVPPADPARAALATDPQDPAATVRHAELAAWWSGEDADRPRVLLAPRPDVAGWLRDVLRVLAADGSVVLLSPARAAGLAQDAAAFERLVATERVTRTQA
ncbi:TIGR03089 family protein [Cellulomonas uda]|uniref:Acyl-CoA synthetase n=1 Tax=Cellulomonas uda TaxID=1714 RepID=A0A4Y3KAF1_CELUD|nr:TIGR03089 family protein [Cellulomonas uda]NII65299.1 uncharacterized protein (TIGR03089 family) [Cellulomonas uda]GEA79800.1 acyl-CoA synthetase [Cellulomonas uda]